jgi:hypothetical protein
MSQEIKNEIAMLIQAYRETGRVAFLNRAIKLQRGGR